MKSKLFTAAIASLALSTLQGCSTLGIGEDEFSCSGMPEGTRCMSVRDVYDNTHNGNVPVGTIDGKIANSSNLEDAEDGDVITVRRDLIDNYAAPDTPNQSTPIRTPAQVMRIWIAPYQDKSGDLVVPSYVYTEIEPRKWLYDAPANQAPRLSPIQTLPPVGSAQDGQTSAAN